MNHQHFRHRVARRSLALAAVVGTTALLLGAPQSATAQSGAANPFADKSVRIVVPYPPGGLTDVVTRVLSDELGRALGATGVVVENRAGAGGLVGLQAVLQAPKDGLTVGLVVPATMITLPLTNPNFKIKPLEDLEPITAVVETFLTLVVDPRLGVKSLAEFVDHARKAPGKLNYGTPGPGTSFHFNNVLLAQRLGINTTHVAYKGESQFLADIAAGQLHYALVSSAGKPFIDGNRVTALAVSSDNRVSALPNVPTFKELGTPFTSDGWVGYAVAGGTPPATVTRLNEAFVKALNAPAVKQKLTEMSFILVGNTPAQFRTMVQDGNRRYGELLKSGAIKIEQ